MFRFIIAYFFSISFNPIQAQKLEKGTLSASISVGAYKPSTFGEINNHPFMFDIGIQYYIKKGFTIGLEYQSLSYSDSLTGRSPLQQAGTNWTYKSLKKVRYQSIGPLAILSSQLLKNAYLNTGVFVQYLHCTDIEYAKLYSNGIPIGIELNTTSDKGYYLRTGINLSFVYLIKPAFGLNFRFAEYEYRLRRRNDDLFFSAPFLLGIQYHFKIIPTKLLS
jgi:hypothetical protein